MLSLDGIPAWSIPLVREALAAQGIARESITDAGDIDAGLLATSLMDTVTIRTNITPDLEINVRDAVTGPSSPITRALQPTLIIRGGAAGQRIIAPHGESHGGGFVFFGLLALGVATAARIYRKSKSA
jgi:hypothetical protein